MMVDNTFGTMDIDNLPYNTCDPQYTNLATLYLNKRYNNEIYKPGIDQLNFIESCIFISIKNETYDEIVAQG